MLPSLLGDLTVPLDDHSDHLLLDRTDVHNLDLAVFKTEYKVTSPRRVPRCPRQWILSTFVWGTLIENSCDILNGEYYKLLTSLDCFLPALDCCAPILIRSDVLLKQFVTFECLLILTEISKNLVFALNLGPYSLRQFNLSSRIKSFSNKVLDCFRLDFLSNLHCLKSDIEITSWSGVINNWLLAPPAPCGSRLLSPVSGPRTGKYFEEGEIWDGILHAINYWNLLCFIFPLLRN